MPLESATYASQLQVGNPQSSDPRSQGDDHLRLLKTVIQTELSSANRQWIYTGDTIDRRTATTFTLASDKTADYEENRRIKVEGASTGTIYGTISSSTFSTQTAVSIKWDSGSMADEAITPFLSIMTATNQAFFSGVINKVKSADTTATSNTTLAIDPHLSGWNLAGNAWYSLEGYLVITGTNTTPDFKARTAHSPSTGSLDYINWQADDNSGTSEGDVVVQEENWLVQVPNGTVGVRISGSIYSAVANTWNFEWAQNTSHASDTVLKAGSWIRVARIL